MSDQANSGSIGTGGAAAPASTSSAPNTSHNTSSASEGSNSADGSNGSSEAAAPAAKATPAAPRYMTIKVDGREVRMTEDEVIRQAQLGHASGKRFSEAAAKEQAVKRIIGTAKSNPIQALMDPELGLSKDQVREAFETWYRKEFIEPETLTPEQREIAKYKEEAEKYKSEREQEQQSKQQQELTRATEHWTQEYQKQMVGALETSGLPKNEHTVGLMARYMKLNLEGGYNAPMEVVVQQVRNDFRQIVDSFVSNASGEQLVQMFGEGLVNQIRKFDLQRLRAKDPILAQQQGQQAQAQQGQTGELKQGKPISWSQARSYFDKL